MSGVQSRTAAPRGRGSNRGGRGGHRGGSRSGNEDTNGQVSKSAPEVSIEEQGELGQLKKHYKPQLDTLKELFSDWSDDDLVFALQETDGDLQSTIERITEGNVSRFADVKKKAKEKSRIKSKEAPTSAPEVPAATTRGRGRGGSDGARGGRGRGRGTERGRGGARAGRGGAGTTLNGIRSTSTTSMPTAEVVGWGEFGAAAANATESSRDQHAAISWADASIEGNIAAIPTSEVVTQVVIETPKSSLIPEGATKSWASMLATSTAPIVAKLPATALTTLVESGPQAELPRAADEVAQLEVLAPVSLDYQTLDIERPELQMMPSEGAILLSPPRDQLTEDNLEHLPDVSIPPTSETVASTRDAGSAIGNMTPLGGPVHGFPPSRPPMGGYATSAWKATGLPGRSASYQRRILEQQEAVVMPANLAVDRAAVQFGSMGLGHESENNQLDVDEDREDAETRAQPPAQSPTQPRASLPPAPAPYPQPLPAETILQDGLPTPKQTPGYPLASLSQQLPPPNQQSAQNPNIHDSSTESSIQMGSAQAQYGRYGSGTLGQEHAVPMQKPYDPFSSQLNYSQSQHDSPAMYPSQTQNPGHAPPQIQPQPGYSQAQNDYGAQFPTDAQRNNNYQSYYGGSYGQQGPSGQSENVPPQRSGSAYGAHESNYGTTLATQSSSRFSETHASGQTTPNTAATSLQQTGPQNAHGQHLSQQSHGQGGQGGGYPYGNHYYGGSYYGQYMNHQYPNQYNYNQQGGYSAPYGGKGGAYGQSHHGYGPQSGYEHSSSPANAGGFGASSQGREAGYPGGFNDYARAGSAQQGQGQQPSASGAYPGGMPESFNRVSSNYLNHNHNYGISQPSGNDDSLKAFHENKTGPSPALGPSGRSGSGANSVGPQSSQGNYLPPQSHQQSYGTGYPNHMNQLQGNQNSHYGGVGSLGGHQAPAHSQHAGGSGYTGYPSNYGNSYGSYGRGGWGGNYGH